MITKGREGGYETYSFRVQTVTEITRSVRGLLESSYPFVTVLGQISNLRRPHSGHCYFTLKDEGAQLRAVIFKNQLRYLERFPEEGLEVLCRGRLSVYESRGEYQLLVDFMSTRGAGELQVAFERLKRRLGEEGLFDAARKRPLPLLPEKIAVVTSPGGAALFDFLTVAARRFPSVPVEIFPVRVQGEGAAEEIAQALEAANERASAQVVVLCRGGGSIEDLWAFNEERLARAIYHSTIPVVSAVGHEVDLTIADLVADQRAPTPSAAAEMVLPERKVLLCRAIELEERLARSMQRRLTEAQMRVKLHRHLLGDPTSLLAHFLLVLDHSQTELLAVMENKLQQWRAETAGRVRHLLEHSPRQKLWVQAGRLSELAMRLRSAMERQLAAKGAACEKAASVLGSVSPLAVLSRGYAIVRTAGGEVVRSRAQVRTGETLEVLLHRGELVCEVKAEKKLKKRRSP